jgi:hypothetical protein
MAETINIAKMAEKLSKGIFLEFLWGRMEHTNLNWPCEDQENHECQRRLNNDPPCRFKIDPGRVASF